MLSLNVNNGSVNIIMLVLFFIFDFGIVFIEVEISDELQVLDGWFYGIMICLSYCFYESQMQCGNLSFVGFYNGVVFSVEFEVVVVIVIEDDYV